MPEEAAPTPASRNSTFLLHPFVLSSSDPTPVRDNAFQKQQSFRHLGRSRRLHPPAPSAEHVSATEGRNSCRQGFSEMPHITPAASCSLWYYYLAAVLLTEPEGQGKRSGLP